MTSRNSCYIFNWLLICINKCITASTFKCNYICCDVQLTKSFISLLNLRSQCFPFRNFLRTVLWRDDFALHKQFGYLKFFCILKQYELINKGLAPSSLIYLHDVTGPNNLLEISLPVGSNQQLPNGLERLITGIPPCCQSRLERICMCEDQATLSAFAAHSDTSQFVSQFWMRAHKNSQQYSSSQPLNQAEFYCQLFTTPLQQLLFYGTMMIMKDRGTRNSC